MMIETLQTPVVRRCDVLVCGGGFAGISAALAAARLGKKVILLEREFMLGGLGTAGLVTEYLPLCDGMGHQVSFGIAEELLRLSISMGAEAGYPAGWLDADDISRRGPSDPRFRVRYNPHLFAMLAEQLLLEHHVEILYGCYAAAVQKNGNRIEAVIMESKSGRQAIAAACVVDASGDCDIAHFAGAPTASFQQGNVLAAWYYFLDASGYDLHMLGFADVPDSRRRDAQDAPPLLAPRRFTGLDAGELSQMVQLSHQCILQDVRRRRLEDPSIVPTAIASIPQIRMTRRLEGAFTLSDAQMHTRFADSVGMVSDWRQRGPVYEVPYSILYSRAVPNLITAGRCVSVTDGMWDIMRVIPCCAVTGQAAGTAAALTDDFPSLDVRALQTCLMENGVVLHE